jgi:hypothetical protein
MYDRFDPDPKCVATKYWFRPLGPLKKPFSKQHQKLGPFNMSPAPDAPSYIVDGLRRTVAPHGITSAEVKRFSGAMHLMKRRVRVEGELWWLTTPCAL